MKERKKRRDDWRRIRRKRGRRRKRRRRRRREEEARKMREELVLPSSPLPIIVIFTSPRPLYLYSFPRFVFVFLRFSFLPRSFRSPRLSRRVALQGSLSSIFLFFCLFSIIRLQFSFAFSNVFLIQVSDLLLFVFSHLSA